MGHLWLDLETFSEADVKRVGAWRYANDWSTEVILIGTAWDEDDPTSVSADELRAQVRKSEKIFSHNAQFERDILTYVLGIHTDPSQWVDTAAYAAACGLPRKLSTLCKVLKLPVDQAKDKRGSRLISLLCQPNKLGKRNRNAELEAEFAEYNLQDVVAMRECWRRLPDKTLTPTERRLMQVDMLINERGVRVDVDLAKAAQRQYAEYVSNADNMLHKAAGGAVGSVSQVAELRDYLSQQGVSLPDLRATTVEDALAGDLPDDVRHILELRQIGAKTGGAKFDRFVELTDIDGRAHDCHMYAAAHTLRWGGRMLQPQNMPRPDRAVGDTDVAAEIVRAGEIDEWYANPMTVLNSVVRSCIIPSSGNKLLVGDYAQIEARIVPWLAGQEDVLQAFRRGDDIYVIAAAGIFRVPPEKVTKEQRMVGKVAILALGFGGGVAAFESMAKQYRTTVPSDVDDIIKRWRGANKKIYSLWYDVDRAFREVVSEDYNGDVVKVGKHLRFTRKGKTVRVVLPNDLSLRYHGAHVDDGDSIRYLGMDSKTFNWSLQYTWGGKIVQNITEFVGRSILGEALIDLEDAGLAPVLHVHDEVVCDAAGDRLDEFKACMEKPRSWAAGLPVVADCHALPRYRKM